jgi:hypothetical protein
MLPTLPPQVIDQVVSYLFVVISFIILFWILK